MKAALIVLLALALVALVAWAGLCVRPRPLPAFSGTAADAPTATLRLPGDLPAPVARFYGALYGADVSEYVRSRGP